MIVAAARVELHIPSSHSLKEKRSVIRPVIAHLQRQFQLSVAEVAQQDHRQIAVLGLAYVSSDARHAEEVIARALKHLEMSGGEGILAQVQTETVHLLT